VIPELRFTYAQAFSRRDADYPHLTLVTVTADIESRLWSIQKVQVGDSAGWIKAYRIGSSVIRASE
jgi:hypothetical protein